MAEDYLNWRSISIDRRLSFPAKVTLKKGFSGEDEKHAKLSYGNQKELAYHGDAEVGVSVRVFNGNLSESWTIQPNDRFFGSGGPSTSSQQIFVDVEYAPKEAGIDESEYFTTMPIKWQPIQTAPTDEVILGYDPRTEYGIVTMKWGEGGWELYPCSDWSCDPIRWMPLPENPLKAEAEEQEKEDKIKAAWDKIYETHKKNP